MQAVILAGGKGTRLRPITNTVPKPMAPINNKPFLEYLIKLLKKNRITNIVICTGYLGEQIEGYFKEGSDFGVDISYSKEDLPLGTAGALKNAGALLDEVFLVMNGDTLFDANLEELEKNHIESKNRRLATIALAEEEETEERGNVEIGRDSKIISFEEKKKGSGNRYINAGIYVLEKKILESLPVRFPISIEIEVFPKLINQGMLYGMVCSGYFIDIGTHKNYIRLQNEIERLGL